MTTGTRRRRVARALLLAVTAGLATAAVGLAAATTLPDANDTKGRIDIKSVTAGKTSTGLLRIVVTFYATVPSQGETGNEWIYLWTKKPHRLSGAPPGAFVETPYKIMGPQTGTRPVFTGGEEGTPIHKTGTAKVTRNGNKLTFVFSRKAIGNPSSFYFWHVKSDFYGPESTCPMGPCEDNAPNGSNAVKQPL
jgi:hypothetical protein